MSKQPLNLAQVFNLSHKYNFVFFLDALTKIYNGVEVAPFSLEIRPNYNCNLDCKFCYNKLLRRDLGYFSIHKDHWFHILRRIEDGPLLKNIILNGGGEPLMYDHRRLHSLFKLAKEKDILMTVVTNGTPLGRRMIDLLKDNNCLINISIKSTDRDGFVSVTGKDLFMKQIDNLNYYLQMRKRSNNHVVVARYVFAEPLNPEFDIENFTCFLNKLFEKGLDVFLVTFSNPYFAIHNSKSRSYSTLYKKLINDKDISSLVLQGRVRFNNLRYLIEDYPDVYCVNYVNRTNVDIKFKCYVDKLISVIDPRGTFNCLHQIDEKTSSNLVERYKIANTNICHSCIYYNYNNTITRIMPRIVDYDSEQLKPDYLIKYVTEMFRGIIDNEDLEEMLHFIVYIISSKNIVVKGLPYVLH